MNLGGLSVIWMGTRLQIQKLIYVTVDLEIDFKN